MRARRALPWFVSIELAVLGGWPAAEPRAPEASARGGGQAPGEACVDCHAEIVASYRRTGMARALEPMLEPHAAELARLAEVREPATGYRYRFAAEAGHARIVESFAPPGSDGAATEVGSAPLAFAIGAGLFDRSFAARRGGRLWFAPLEVFSTGAQPHAALAPGHAQSPGLRFESPIAIECLACHTDALPLEDYPLNAEPPPSWTPRGISCGACHGDVDGHVRWRQADLVGEKPEGADPLLELARLDRIGRMSTCARCHLQGDARLALRPGARGLPRAGGDLLDELAVFVARGPTEDIGFVSHVERLVLSPCYVQSGGSARELSCESCHDPHRSVFEDGERARVRAACLTCHPSGESDRSHTAKPCGRTTAPADGARDCASCHMRRTSVFDLHEVEIHDHFIRARPPPPSRFETIRAKQAQRPELERFAWPQAAAPALLGDPGLELMALTSANQGAAARTLVDERPAPQVFRLAMYHHLRASLLEQAGRLEDARVAYERALLLDPSQAESAVNLGLVLARLGSGEKALAELDEVLRVHPRAEGALRNRALANAALGRRAAARADLEAAQALLERAENARALAELCAQEGDGEAAQRWRAEARRLDPARE